MLLPIGDMAEARLVLTDALIAESLRRGKAAERAQSAENNDNAPLAAANTNERKFRGKPKANRRTSPPQGD